MSAAAKDYLSKIRKLDIETINASDLLQSAESDAARITRPLSFLPRGGKRRDIADVVDNLTQLREWYKKKNQEYVKYKNTAIDMLVQLDDPQHRQVLFMRYFEYRDNCGRIGKLKTLEEIAHALNYSQRQIYRIYNAALKAYDEILLKNGLLPN